MDGDAIRLSSLLRKMSFPAPWKFDGMFVNEERKHVELRFSCPRGTRHRCTECGGVDQPAHDFRDHCREHDRFMGWRCFMRARVPRIGRGHCGSVRSASVPRARPGSGFTLRFEALQLRMRKIAPARAFRIRWV